MILAAVSIVSCGNDNNDQPKEVSIDFKCTTSEINFPADGGKDIITVESPSKPEITISEDWATVEHIAIQEAQNSIYKITINALANPEDKERTAIVSLKAGENSAEVKLYQSANLIIEVDRESVAEAEKPFPAEGGQRSIKVSYNHEYSATATASWITIDETRSLQDGAVTFSVAANTSVSSRSGSIVLSPVGSSDVDPLTVNIRQEAGNAQEPLNLTALNIAADMFAGINIGNTMEVPGGETGWGNPKVNELYIQGLKDAGFNAIRIPCAWDSHIVNAANHTIDPAWLDRVSEVVGWIVDRDMYAIVNIHWDGGWLEENVNVASKDKVLPKQKALWTQIADKLNGYNERLLFAGTNEPYQSRQDQFGTSEMGVLLEYEQAFVDAVRATGGNNLKRTLVVQGPATSIDLTEKLMSRMPEDIVDDRMMAEIHFYDPWNLCGMEKDESWGKMSFFWGKDNFVDGSDRNSTWGDEDYMIGQFDKMKKQFVDKGIPVIIGEYGAIIDHSTALSGSDLKARHLASRAYFNKCVSLFGKERGLVPFLWDTGEIFNRTTGEVKAKEIVNAIMEGSQEGTYPF